MAYDLDYGRGQALPYRCPTCWRLMRENEDLRKRNTDLANALAAQPTLPATALIVGAAISGGDARKLAKALAKNKRSS